METIVLASNNKHKVKEFRKILADYKVISLSDIGFNEEIDETGETFRDNALIKAETVHKFLREKGLSYMVVADDTGLCVDSLGGAPGVISARYAGVYGDDQANRDKLRKELEGKDTDACFVCTIVLYFASGEYKVFEGKTLGNIIMEERGESGFAYDCIFYSKELKKTFGEATEEEKNSVSHRGRAIEAMLKYFNNGEERMEYDTLDYYNKNAELYFSKTIKAALQENYDTFLKHLKVGSYILDFGCGSGRDSLYFMEHGYKVRAIDGSREMCKIASNYIKQSVEEMKFEELNDIEKYDGIWACSSILHVPKEELPDILKKMVKALKSEGVIYASFKKGTGYEIKEGKYYNYLIKEELSSILRELNMGVEIVDYFETLPSTNRPNAENTIWCNYIIKKIK
ncbi:MAG: RdgB/HAM1 family non-canonical purine NTP pyrophosphatase [Bacilli bacterium]|nr:RdgB/HAM1 family non-canonical purine NTP pyrophosphatase [Bacilli bacterium]